MSQSQTKRAKAYGALKALHRNEGGSIESNILIAATAAVAIFGAIALANNRNHNTADSYGASGSRGGIFDLLSPIKRMPGICPRLDGCNR